MSAIRNGAAIVGVCAAIGLLSGGAPAAQTRGTLATIVPGSAQALRDWDTRTQSMRRLRQLKRARQILGLFG